MWDDRMYRLRPNPRELRVAVPTSIEAMNLWADWQVLHPRWWSRVRRRFPNIHSLAMFNHDLHRPVRKQGETWRQAVYRYLPANLVEERSKVEGDINKVLRAHARHSTVPMHEDRPCPLCKFSWKKLARIAMFGNPGNWRAAKELGFERIPVVKVSMTEAQRRIATMRHNRARGQDDTSQVAELFLDLEKLGALEWAQDALRLSDEEVRRLVAMADTVAEDLSRGHTFSQAWEPAERSTYQPPEKPGEHISYSRPISTQDVEADAPGGGDGSKADVLPEPMTRRQYVLTLSEAEVVDRVLGERAAARL